MVASIGFEGSSNKLGIGIVKDGEELANPRHSFMPKVTAIHHRQHVIVLIIAALKEAHITLKDIGIVCCTEGPVLGPPLISVAIVKRTEAQLWKKPIVAVNHCNAHIDMDRLITGSKNPIVLYVSGGNIQIIVYQQKRYCIFGDTIDIAVGNCLHRLACSLNLFNDPSPGYNIEQSAKKGQTYITLPYVVEGMDASFSGLLSYLEEKVPILLNITKVRDVATRSEFIVKCKIKLDGQFTF